MLVFFFVLLTQRYRIPLLSIVRKDLHILVRTYKDNQFYPSLFWQIRGYLFEYA